MYGSIVSLWVLKIHLFLAAWVFVVAGLSLVGVSRGYSPLRCMCSFLIAVAPLVSEHRL